MDQALDSEEGEYVVTIAGCYVFFKQNLSYFARFCNIFTNYYLRCSWVNFYLDKYISMLRLNVRIISLLDI